MAFMRTTEQRLAADTQGFPKTWNWTPTLWLSGVQTTSSWTAVTPAQHHILRVTSLSRIDTKITASNRLPINRLPGIWQVLERKWEANCLLMLLARLCKECSSRSLQGHCQALQPVEELGRHWRQLEKCQLNHQLVCYQPGNVHVVASKLPFLLWSLNCTQTF